MPKSQDAAAANANKKRPSNPPAPTRQYGTLEEDTFTIRVINTINYRQTKLTITKKYTINDIHVAYAPFESHPEYYLWTDMFGKTLDLAKNVVENGLVDAKETVEFDGIGKEPCILLVFKDGFEKEVPRSLNPMMRSAGSGNQACRNY